jgi:signal peptidase II
MRWPTFNVADMAVSTGAFLLAWVLWGDDRAERAALLKRAASVAPDRRRRAPPLVHRMRRSTR